MIKLWCREVPNTPECRFLRCPLNALRATLSALPPICIRSHQGVDDHAPMEFWLLRGGGKSDIADTKKSPVRSTEVNQTGDVARIVTTTW
jgi:hypothetical protein